MENPLTKKQKSEIYSTLSEEPMEITVPWVPRNLWDRVKKLIGRHGKTRTLTITPITLGSRERYAKYAVELEIDKFAPNITSDRLHNIVASGKMRFLNMCIATVIHNKKSVPPKWLLRTIENLTINETLEVINVLKISIDVNSFLTSIISITGMSLEPVEIIASEEERKTPGE